jgi:cell division protein FtsN
MRLNPQHGSTFMGFSIGLVLGLGVAMAVAIYVTKVPTPFSNKNQPRTSAQDQQESEKNKDWNPNTVLQPKAVPAPPQAPPPPVEPVAIEKPLDKPADKPIEKSTPETAKSAPRPAVTADPLGDLAKAKSSLNTPSVPADASDPFDYVVQAGAYRTSADADAQKAKLAMLGLDAKVSERDQTGRLVYRVRLGPYSDKSTAERIRAQLENSGIDNTLVRVQR